MSWVNLISKTPAEKVSRVNLLSENTATNSQRRKLKEVLIPGQSELLLCNKSCRRGCLRAALVRLTCEYFLFK